MTLVETITQTFQAFYDIIAAHPFLSFITLLIIAVIIFDLYIAIVIGRD